MPFLLFKHVLISRSKEYNKTYNGFFNQVDPNPQKLASVPVLAWANKYIKLISRTNLTMSKVHGNRKKVLSKYKCQQKIWEQVIGSSSAVAFSPPQSNNIPNVAHNLPLCYRYLFLKYRYLPRNVQYSATSAKSVAFHTVVMSWITVPLPPMVSSLISYFIPDLPYLTWGILSWFPFPQLSFKALLSWWFSSGCSDMVAMWWLFCPDRPVTEVLAAAVL
jgi:hypothetical protein